MLLTVRGLFDAFRFDVGRRWRVLRISLRSKFRMIWRENLFSRGLVNLDGLASFGVVPVFPANRVFLLTPFREGPFLNHKKGKIKSDSIHKHILRKQCHTRNQAFVFPFSLSLSRADVRVTLIYSKTGKCGHFGKKVRTKENFLGTVFHCHHVNEDKWTKRGERSRVPLKNPRDRIFGIIFFFSPNVLPVQVFDHIFREERPGLLGG